MFLSHEFLSALHETGCASSATGWTPQYLLLKRDGRLAGAMPLYLKTHSYGEYVFDWAWADAYHRHGVAYYPKLLSAVPFTPVTGTRLLAETDDDRDLLIAAALELARALRVSSLHCLFAVREEAQRMVAHGMMPRTTVQFHWANRGYGSFEEFLGGFSHDKRKKVKQERRRVGDAGIRFKWLEGDEINERDWSFLHRCYRQTYREHQSSPYLNLEFFCRIGRTLPQHMVLIVAERDGAPIAASLNIRDSGRLCGRYWGALQHHPALHFETCYYQGIEYLHRPRHRGLRGRLAGRAQAGARPDAGRDLLGALAGAPGIRGGGRAVSCARNERPGTLFRRTERAQSLQALSRSGNRRQ